MSWDADLSLVEGKARKFWRARVEGSDLVINYGRHGSEGQSKTKSFDSGDEARAELQRLIDSKKGKGFKEVSSAASLRVAPNVAPSTAGVEFDGPVKLSLSLGSRTLTVELTVEGSTLQTVSTESYPDEGSAKAALARIRQALLDEGYSE